VAYLCSASDKSAAARRTRGEPARTGVAAGTPGRYHWFTIVSPDKRKLSIPSGWNKKQQKTLTRVGSSQAIVWLDGPGGCGREAAPWFHRPNRDGRSISSCRESAWQRAVVAFAPSGEGASRHLEPTTSSATLPNEKKKSIFSNAVKAPDQISFFSVSMRSRGAAVVFYPSCSGFHVGFFAAPLRGVDWLMRLGCMEEQGASRIKGKSCLLDDRRRETHGRARFWHRGSCWPDPDCTVWAGRAGGIRGLLAAVCTVRDRYSSHCSGGEVRPVILVLFVGLIPAGLTCL